MTNKTDNDEHRQDQAISDNTTEDEPQQTPVDKLINKASIGHALILVDHFNCFDHSMKQLCGGLYACCTCVGGTARRSGCTRF